jgi:repressor LexA
LKNLLGPAIKSFRKEKGMTQSDLSKLTGFSQNTISNHENQNRAITEKDIATYASALGVSPQQLFDYVTDHSNVVTFSKDSESIISIFNKLDIKRKKEVLDFATFKLYEQQRNEEIFTIAAHSDDPNKKVSKEEFKKINSFLDELDRKFDKK